MILTLLFANLLFLPSPFYNLGNVDRNKCSYEHHCMLHKIPEFEWYYVAYLKDDPAKEPIAASYSAPGVLAEAALKGNRILLLINACSFLALKNRNQKKDLQD